MILILGATGQIGRPLVDDLVRSGVKFRALAHSEGSAAKIKAPGVEVVVGDMHDPASLKKNLADVDQLFLLTPPNADQVREQNAIVDIAAEAGVGAIVKLSVYSAAPDAFPSISRWHWENDQYLAHSGLNYTILHPNTFMQTIALQFASEIRVSGTMSAAVRPECTISMVDALDVSQIAAAVLRRNDHRNETLLITGPEAISYPDCAQLIGEQIGSPVNYEALTPEATLARFTAQGMPEWAAQVRVDLHRLYDTNSCNPISDVTYRLLGRPARSFREFVEQNPASFA